MMVVHFGLRNDDGMFSFCFEVVLWKLGLKRRIIIIIKFRIISTVLLQKQFLPENNGIHLEPLHVIDKSWAIGYLENTLRKHDGRRQFW